MFANDFITEKEFIYSDGAFITDVAATISTDVSKEAIEKGESFANEITAGFISDFEKPCDKMAHVSTFMLIDGTIYMTYYANTKEPSEDPTNQTARLVYVKEDDIDNKVYLDIQTAGDTVFGKRVDMVYDTIMMRKDSDTIYVMWTARVEENYYRFYCPFTISTKTLGDVKLNRFTVGDITNDFSSTGIRSALAANSIPCKKMFSDIGIMQKITSRIENGATYYYTGTYSGDFTAIIKSRDMITWEYVSQPDFINDSKWENATFVLGDKCYYFVRQQDGNKYGFLTAYNFSDGSWDKPVHIGDSQSRSDFIYYKGGLYLFHAPIDRNHIGIVKIDTENIAESRVLLQAKMDTSCFYPYIDYYKDKLAMSYTISRHHIRLAKFDFELYV